MPGNSVGHFLYKVRQIACFLEFFQHLCIKVCNFAKTITSQ